jgi:hypothetical protein
MFQIDKLGVPFPQFSCTEKNKHHQEKQRGDAKAEPSAMCEFIQVRNQERNFNREK